MTKRIHLVGFGSQGRAWAHCLRKADWQVNIYLHRRAKTFESALYEEYSVALVPALKNLVRDGELVVMLCPDSEIGPIYDEYLAPLERELTVVLAHGYAVYSGALRPKQPLHEAALLAPKAIGAKLQEGFDRAFEAGTTHERVAGAYFPESRRALMSELAEALRFAPQNLVPATFDQETIGDLISEQGLLCGGVFTLLQWTMQEMERAGVPDGLIREECLTELELIAGVLNERGPEGVLRRISQVAACGTVAMKERIEKTELRKEFKEQADEVVSKRFVKYVENEGHWKKEVEVLAADFKIWQDRLNKKETVR